MRIARRKEMKKAALRFVGSRGLFVHRMRKEIAGDREWQYNAPAQLPFHHALGTAQADKEGSSHADRFHPAYSYGLSPVLGIQRQITVTPAH